MSFFHDVLEKFVLTQLKLDDLNMVVFRQDKAL